MNIIRNLIFFDPITKAHQNVYGCTAINTVGSSYESIIILVHENSATESPEDKLI